MSAPFLFGIGNPLLDISAVTPASVLTKYGLEAGSAILCEDKHKPIYQELVDNYEVEYIAGGAAQNSVRACQWYLQTAGATCYVGSVGVDKFGELLETNARKDGVDVHYLKHDDIATGTCACVIVDKERSLVANLSAANHYKREHFETEEVQQLLKKATHFVATGFFLTVEPSCLVSIGEHAAENDKPFVLNVGAPFILQFFKSKVEDVLPFTDYVIGNEDEAKALGAAFGWGEDLVEVAQKLSTYEKKNTKRSRVVIFTQSSKDAIVVQDGKELFRLAPTPVPEEEIVDANGAGDSFVGGFCAALMRGASLEDCVKVGHNVAGYTIRHSGSTFDGKPSF